MENYATDKAIHLTLEIPKDKFPHLYNAMVALGSTTEVCEHTIYYMLLVTEMRLEQVIRGVNID